MIEFWTQLNFFFNCVFTETEPMRCDVMPRLTMKTGNSVKEEEVGEIVLWKNNSIEFNFFVCLFHFNQSYTFIDCRIIGVERNEMREKFTNIGIGIALSISMLFGVSSDIFDCIQLFKLSIGA